MKLSELEKLSDELLSGVPEDMFERNWTQDAIQCLNTLPVFCATFREMLDVLKHVQGCMPFPVSEKLIKKAEEML